VIGYIDENKGAYGIEPICRELQVAPQTYYAAKSRPPSARTCRHHEMKPKIMSAWEQNYRVYGAHKLWKQLQRQGEA
jgi:putative transposase